MLHRGKYDTAHEHIDRGKVGWIARVFGITPEFTLGDKILYASTILWTVLWLVVFIWFSVQKACIGVSNGQWLALWRFKVYLTLILGVGCTIWFLIGGVIDSVRLFHALKYSVRNDADDGSVPAADSPEGKRG